MYIPSSCTGNCHRLLDICPATPSTLKVVRSTMTTRSVQTLNSYDEPEVCTLLVCSLAAFSEISEGPVYQKDSHHQSPIRPYAVPDSRRHHDERRFHV